MGSLRDIWHTASPPLPRPPRTAPRVTAELRLHLVAPAGWMTPRSLKPELYLVFTVYWEKRQEPPLRNVRILVGGGTDSSVPWRSWLMRFPHTVTTRGPCLCSGSQHEFMIHFQQPDSSHQLPIPTQHGGLGGARAGTCDKAISGSQSWRMC